jgi:hypothetical protein
MKKKISFLLMLFVVVLTKAQDVNQNNINAKSSFSVAGVKITNISKDSAAKYGSDDKLMTEKAIKAYVRLQTSSLNTVAEFAAFSGAGLTAINVADTIRGGHFNIYTGTDAVDNGMVFADAIGNKWKRQTADAVINAQWYGAKGYSSGAYDSKADIIKARDYIYNHKRYTTLYLPSVRGDFYYITDSLLFNKQITIQGDGANETKLKFPVNKTGLVFRYAYGQPSFTTTISDFSIVSSQSGTGPYYIKRHAITSNTLCYITNVAVEQFGGDGLHISACANPTAGENNNYGNASNSVIKNFTAHYCTNGIFIEGCDANAMLIENADLSQNRRWGLFDNGMLGNRIVKPHCAFNGVPAIDGANSVVLYNGKHYTAKPGHDGYWNDATDSNYNKQPDINPSYWLQVSPMTNTVWNKSKRYYSGGPIVIKNVNAFSGIENAYTEGFQPPIYLNSRSKVDGAGDNGAGVYGGPFWNTIFGEVHLANSGLMLQKYLHVGTTIYDASAQFKIYNDNAATGTFVGELIEGTTAKIYLAIKNNSGKSALIGYVNNDLNSYTENNKLITTQNVTGVHPGADNTLDMGNASQKWKTAYINTIQSTKINVATGADATIGTGTLSGGTVTISNTAVTAASKIFVTLANCSSCGTIYISTIKAGASFVVRSSNANDASNFNWWIIN